LGGLGGAALTDSPAKAMLLASGTGVVVACGAGYLHRRAPRRTGSGSAPGRERCPAGRGSGSPPGRGPVGRAAEPRPQRLGTYL
ncbi:DedA family protein, partial [Streptomyces decoyicus]